MKSALNQKDREILLNNTTTDLGFGTNSQDYVQALLYDTNDNLIETSVVESSDYSIEDGSVKLKTGTIIRKMGFDRGRYRVKYNFLRRKAGSHEVVLVDGNNQIYDGSYHVMENGHIMKGEEHSDGSERLYIKENKYLIHEISPSRNEVRVIPQNIDDKKYIDDLFYSGKQRKRTNADFSVKFITANPGGTTEVLTDSITLEADKDVPLDIKGGLVYIENALIKSKIFEEPETSTLTQPENEIIGDTLLARWIVSDTSLARKTGGNIFAVNESWNQFSGPQQDDPTSIEELIKSYESNDPNNRVIPFDSPIFAGESTIKLKSVSTKPSDAIGVQYTWTISGRDFHQGEKRSDNVGIQNFILDGTQDVGIEEAGGLGNVRYVSPISTDGSEITLKLNDRNMELGVRLKIETKFNNEDLVSEVYLPNIIRTARFE